MDADELARRRFDGETVDLAHKTLNLIGAQLMMWLDPATREEIGDDLRLIHRLTTETGVPIPGSGGFQIMGGRTGLTLVRTYARVFRAFDAARATVQPPPDPAVTERVELLVQSLELVEEHLRNELGDPDADR
jgi:hypothetical protein